MRRKHDTRGALPGAPNATAKHVSSQKTPSTPRPNPKTANRRHHDPLLMAELLAMTRSVVGVCIVWLNSVNKTQGPNRHSRDKDTYNGTANGHPFRWSISAHREHVQRARCLLTAWATPLVCWQLWEYTGNIQWWISWLLATGRL
ncbi:hypothetical protein IFR05_003992 [Cadophora sp. M221]|nr:hypothetical protein IFR05_003992 [Cadophora sp. M221]